MADMMTATGLVATELRTFTTRDGMLIVNFRLACTQRKFDRQKGAWENGDTNWYTVYAYRRLAQNLLGSLAKGNRVVVTGRLRIRNWDGKDRSGTSVEIDADAIGHDLTWGTATFTRSVARSTGAQGDTGAQEDPGSGVDGDEAPQEETSEDGFVPPAGADGWGAPQIAAAS